jgi:magnesium-transporting ATPase (P-type)
VITRGSGLMMVIAVRETSANSTNLIEPKKSKMKADSQALKAKISRMAYISCLIVFLVLMTRFIYEGLKTTAIEEKQLTMMNSLLKCSEILRISMLLVIIGDAFDGLLSVMMLSLAFTMGNLLKDNVLVRNIEALSHLG